VVSDGNQIINLPLAGDLNDQSGNDNNGTLVGDASTFWSRIPARQDGSSIVRPAPSNPAVDGPNNAETKVRFPAFSHLSDHSFGDDQAGLTIGTKTPTSESNFTVEPT